MEKLRLPNGDVSVLRDGPGTAPALVVLGHGAGADITSDFMQVMAEGLADRGLAVVRFNFLYMEQGKKAPDRQPVLEQTFRDVVAALEDAGRRKKLVLGGKSLGGRIASHVAGEVNADGLVFLGYPLHAPGRPDRIRDAHLRELTTPMLFVEGTRDPFCPLPTLEKVRSKLRASTEVAIIDDGDHSLKVRKSSGRSTPEAWQEAIDAVATWVEKLGD